jgi:hypothetical protein
LLFSNSQPYDPEFHKIVAGDLLVCVTRDVYDYAFDVFESKDDEHDAVWEADNKKYSAVNAYLYTRVISDPKPNCTATERKEHEQVVKDWINRQQYQVLKHIETDITEAENNLNECITSLNHLDSQIQKQNHKHKQLQRQFEKQQKIQKKFNNIIDSLKRKLTNHKKTYHGPNSMTPIDIDDCLTYEWQLDSTAKPQLIWKQTVYAIFNTTTCFENKATKGIFNINTRNAIKSSISLYNSRNPPPEAEET